MTTTVFTKGIAAGRLAADALTENFGDLHPPLEAHEALVAADRCYFCHDAPCMTACPTSIDVPLFIRQIATGTPEAAAKTILEANILGGMCARVCPTETLCEEVCVREVAEGKPVEIGRLQRYATDTVMAADVHPFERAAPTGKTVAVVGAGPAGLSAAHRLAMKGHDVTIFDARPKAGGLNEYGIASYKAPDRFAQAEVDWLLKIGGITVEHGKKLGAEIALDTLKAEFDAVFLAIGLAGVNALRLPNTDLEGIRNAVDFIADLRQADDLSSLPVGRNVVVIGGGMTAVDAAVQSKLLGAQNVTMAYRRGADRMSASVYEQELAATKGVHILTHASPSGFVAGDNGAVSAVTFDLTIETENGLESSGETVTVEADQVLLAIGQTLDGAPDGVALERGKIAVDTFGRTSMDGVWAGGDCASGGEDLTVTAVAEGRDAAEDIHAVLMGEG
ncbi:NAD(P)-dependent oxidoreductase [Celeribacter sp.]|uniref:NAD(P)-dependent oxidoreductase n=1 Tax=Celeribacter sp. TaxID=1890673 RepID=UPI003A8D201E